MKMTLPVLKTVTVEWHNMIATDLHVFFWMVILFVLFLLYVYYRLHKKSPPLSIQRSPNNPTIAPDQYNDWESQGTFNPAAIVDDEGVVHLIYRAIGSDGVSRFGYAKSIDGITIDEKVSYPIYQAPPEPYTKVEKIFNPAIYTSGGGWSGAEDPRAVLIDGRVYVTYVAFSGWHSIRIALTSISLEDLKKKRWNWRKPILLSPIGESHKNWVLFPEKINGKFAILHSVSPKILIDYVDIIDMVQYEKPIQSIIGAPTGGRKEYWDSRMRGAGAPPIKTVYGWLLFYHAMDNRDPDKYKIGAMILDNTDPTKILYRSHEPILSPCMQYENDYKPGVVYGSGAVVRNNTLYIYYGGGDKHVCVAYASLDEFIHWLVTNGTV